MIVISIAWRMIATSYIEQHIDMWFETSTYPLGRYSTSSYLPCLTAIYRETLLPSNTLDPYSSQLPRIWKSVDSVYFASRFDSLSSGTYLRRFGGGWDLAMVGNTVVCLWWRWPPNLVSRMEERPARDNVVAREPKCRFLGDKSLEYPKEH